MRNISKTKLGRASMISAIAAVAFIALGANAEARDGHRDHWDGHRDHWHAAPGHWWHGPAYGYRHYGWAPYYAPPTYYAPPAYYAPPTYYAPPAYYGPPSLNFGVNIPLG
jgi:hypothetical protein